MAEPILKWAGGKRQLLDELYGRFPESFAADANSYHEPFLGGGALFFDLEPPRATVNDRNSRLSNLYVQVRDRPADLKRRLKEFRDPEAAPDPDEPYAETTDQYFYQQRALFNRRPRGEAYDELAEAARLLYLNRTCFNGMYRENSDGEFNVPIGRYANPVWTRDEAIDAASAVLGQLPDDHLRNENFDYVIDCAEPGDVVYFDPPYEPMSPTANFAEYSAGGFGRAEQEALLETAKTLRDDGVHVILSNSGVTYDFYDEKGFHVGIEGATRAINSDADNRGEVEEIIATSVPPEDRVSGRADVVPDATTLSEFQ
ncbi:DNA adenine methylase [Halobacteriales archaeon QS_9_67_17]|nr:MAG: DNA adenine methylase [Halobacteriales archaeon QS_9_67_17]